LIYELNGKKPLVPVNCFIADGAVVVGDVVLEEDVSIWFNAVLRGDNERITIGKGSNLQDGVVVHVDSGYPVSIGEYVTVGHNAIVHGCSVGDGVLIGMGATVLTGAVIGEGAIIAAGAVVAQHKVLEPGWLYGGVPAKPVRELSSEEKKAGRNGAVHYIENSRLFKSSLVSLTADEIKED
jgi:carbonic anhydrase/acetyltransferase-like protein (isoleucine patch superfamily)